MALLLLGSALVGIDSGPGSDIFKFQVFEVGLVWFGLVWVRVCGW